MSTGNLNFGWNALNQSLTLNGVITWGGIVGPFFSPAGAGIIYYETADNRLKASENGGPPVNLLTGGGGGSAYEFVQNAGVNVPQENKLNFDGSIIVASDNPGVATNITVTKADATHNGYLSSTDWSTFNSKGSGNGTVTSVALTGDGTVFNSAVPGSPITTSGTLAPTLHTQNNNLVFAGPNGGGPLAPTFRSLVAADLPAGTGTVTSVAASVPTEFNISGSPITTSGTLAITKANETANTVWAGPTTGAAAQPTFRSIVNADLPTSGVTAGSYTNTNLTVNAQGIITSAASGSSGSGADKSVRVFRSTNQSIPNTTFTAISFDTTVFDTDTMSGVGGGNPTRLTCKTAGKFIIQGVVDLSLPVNTTWALRILLNGTTVVAQVQGFDGAHTLDDLVAVDTLFNLAVNDFVELQVFQNGGGAFNAISNASYVPVFSMVRQPG